MTSTDAEQIEVRRDSLSEQFLKVDGRGRVTIPSSVRSLHDVDVEDDDHEIWIEISIKEIDVRDASNDDGGDS